MAILLLLRHGESMWNSKNLFTGWVDVPLSKKGMEEAENAGQKIREFRIDTIHCSRLIRSIMTAMIAMGEHVEGKTPVIMHREGTLKDLGNIYSEETEKNIIPVYCTDALNERMYGELQGKNKDEARAAFGVEQVHVWRRSYSTPPPRGESLEDTTKRAVPYFEEYIQKELEQGKNVFVSAHGNSLRAIIKHIEQLSDEAVVQLELATGVPLLYRYENGSFTKREVL